MGYLCLGRLSLRVVRLGQLWRRRENALRHGKIGESGDKFWEDRGELSIYSIAVIWKLSFTLLCTLNTAIHIIYRRIDFLKQPTVIFILSRLFSKTLRSITKYAITSFNHLCLWTLVGVRASREKSGFLQKQINFEWKNKIKLSFRPCNYISGYGGSKANSN